MLSIIFPVFNAIDAWLGLLLPLVARISVWGITAGTIAMGIYVIISDQAAISNCKLEIRSLRKDMMDTSIDTYSEYSQIALQNLKTSLALLGKVIVPTMLSALPVLLIALWLDSHDNYTISGEQYTVPVKIVPNNKNVRIYPQNLERYIDNGIALRIPPTPSEEITFKIDDYIVYSGKLFWKPTPVLSKKKWWNILVASEVGYIAYDAPIQKIQINFSKTHVLNEVPDWMAGWEFTFFISVFIAALFVKIIFRIH